MLRSLIVMACAEFIVALQSLLPAVQAPSKSSVQQPPHETFEIIRSPLTEASVREAAARVRQALRKPKLGQEPLDRKQCIREFIRVLELCDRQDRWWSRETKSPSDNPPRLKLTDFAFARVIRCLGDLSAEEAVPALLGFFWVPPEDHFSVLPRLGDEPTVWALFQIGDPALPALREKMTSDEQWMRSTARKVALYILGPRADDQLEEWMGDAKTPEERERLAEAKESFERVAKEMQWTYEDFDDYRKEVLEAGRRRVARLPDKPMQEYLEEQHKEQHDKSKKRDVF